MWRDNKTYYLLLNPMLTTEVAASDAKSAYAD